MAFEMPQPEQPGHSVLAATFEYNAWANLRLLDFCEGLNDEQLGSSATGGYGSIYATLRHMVYSEVDYVTRTNGKQPPNPLPEGKWAGFEVMREAVRWANEELFKLAVTASSDTMVVETYPEGTVKYRLADLLVQAPSHAMEHRTHVAAVITSLGLEPPAMDTWAWMEARGAFEEVVHAQSETDAS